MDRKTNLTAKMAEAFCRAFPGIRALAPGGHGDAHLTPAQGDCLRFVFTHPHCRVKDVARGLRVSHPAATKLVDRLVSRGSLERAPNPADRREVNISLTPAGETALSDLRRSRAQTLSAVLGRMAPADRRQLETGLEAYLRAALQTPSEVEAVCGQCGTEHTSECPLSAVYEKLTGRPSPPL